MKLTATEVRKRFIDYFVKNGHENVASSRLIPDNDPTLLFTNSGMVQFKNVFLGFDKRPYKKATTAQKSVRAGGKHNDLENVGHTARHHTFFEMLGNFSFGDYFKKEAIHYAWDFLTNDLKISKDKLYVTVHVSDDEAFNIWTNQEKVPANRISRFDADNFWQMADTGPCGPCSEIFYDHGKDPTRETHDCKVGCSCDRFVEIWNLVFMQFNKDEKGKTTPLPKPSIDTGAGLERLSAVMQGVLSNYDTDIFTRLFEVMEKISGKKYKTNSKDEVSTAMRVMADHSRATAFLIADGVIPSNEGQGYVLRRIMRRGIRFGRKLTDESIIVPTVSEIINMMGDFYTELKTREKFILSTVKTEEERFIATLDQGTTLLNLALEEMKNSKDGVLNGETVFKLYDTYGFPLDLTTLMAKERGIQVDIADFEHRMESQRTQAKASWKGGSGDQTQGLLLQGAQSFKPTVFQGYDSMSGAAKVMGLFSTQGQAVKEVNGEGLAVFDKTTFYAEGGGQVGDKGIARTRSNLEVVIQNTKKFNNVYFHFINGKLKVGDEMSLQVAPERRATMRNHSATHLLHSALRKVVGSHVTQAGSLVDATRLRFDFTHPKPMTFEETTEVEKLVNSEIAQSITVQTQVMSQKEAMSAGAVALFGEKYGDSVRVITMGDFSKELCGGTHVSNTSDIRVFKIMSESGVSSGVRRIEAITGDAAVTFLFKRDMELNQIEENLNSEKGKSLGRVKKVVEASRKLERDLKNALVQGQTTNIDDIINTGRTVKGIKMVSSCLPIADRDMLSTLSDRIKDKIRSGVIVLIGTSENGGPSPIVVSVTKDLIGQFHAGNILKNVAAVMDGKGGGRPDFAQGAGPTSSKAQSAADKAYELL